MHETIIYFEEDVTEAQSIIDFFSDEQCFVMHYTELPEGGLNELAMTFNEPPFLLLMDINVQQHCGFDLCSSLKDTDPFKSVPVFFISHQDEQELILQAYEVGAFDYLAKPVHIKTLQAKYNTLKSFREQHKALQSQVSVSEQMAFDAMVASSDLGNILRFHEKIAEIGELSMLGQAVLSYLTQTGISASIMFGLGSNKPVYLSDDGGDNLLEQKVFQTLGKQGRVYSWKNRTLFNYDTFSVLVRAMPIEDEVRYGTLKDQLCMLLNGVETRLKGIINESKLKRSEENVRFIAQTVANMAMDMQQSNRVLSAKFAKVIQEMEVDISEDLSNLSLLQHEEENLMAHIKQALDEASYIFNTEKEKDSAMAEMLLHMLEQLENPDG